MFLREYNHLLHNDGDVMNKLFLLGDSTCAVKEDSARPETGWGEMFYPYLKDGWTLVNHAQNGRSTEMILLEGIFYDCFWESSEGDYVIIQFGHNENKPEEYRRTDPDGKFVFNLRYMIKNFRSRGVTVILISPISRRYFVNGKPQNTHFGYPAAMKRVAEEEGLIFIEMTQRTLRALDEMGEEESKKMFMNFPAGMYENYPEGKQDNTHLRPEGAAWIASLIADGLKPYDPPFLK